MSTLNIERLFGVKGYVALVTGGTSGLGFMISKVWGCLKLVFCRKDKTPRLTSIYQGFVTNGAKVYVVALPTEPIAVKVSELNEIGRPAGGSAIGQAIRTTHLSTRLLTRMF